MVSGGLAARASKLRAADADGPSLANGGKLTKLAHTLSCAHAVFGVHDPADQLRSCLSP
jgi:hypothetical protein